MAKLKIGTNRNWLTVFSFQLCVITNNVFGTDEQLYVISKVVTLAFFAVMLLRILQKGKIRYNHMLLLPIIFTVYCVATIIWAYDPQRTLAVMISQSQLLVLLLFTFWAMNDGVTLLDYLKAVYISGFAMVLFALYRYGGVGQYVNYMLSGVRMGGEITNQNTFGMVFSNAALCAAYYMILKKRKKHLLSIVLFAFFAFSSASRKATLLMGVGIIVLLALHYGWKRIYKILFIGAVTLIVAYVVLQLPYFREIRGRIIAMFSSEQDMSSLERQQMVKLGISLFKKKPILGYGLGSYGLMYLRDTYSHNNYIELLVSGGIVALIMYYLMFCVPLLDLLLSRRKGEKNDMQLMLYAWIVVEIIYGFALVQLNNKSSWILIGALIAEAARVTGQKARLQEYTDENIS